MQDRQENTMAHYFHINDLVRLLKHETICFNNHILVSTHSNK